MFRTLLIASVLWAPVPAAGLAQNLDPANIAQARAFLTKTYPGNCNENKTRSSDTTNCWFSFRGAGDVLISAGETERGPQDPVVDMIEITIEPLRATENPEVQKHFLYLAHQVNLKGAALIDKYPTIDSLKDFCLKRPDAKKGDGDCHIDETDEPGVSSGMLVEFDAGASFRVAFIAKKH